MPILNRKVRAKVTDQQGKPVSVHPSMALQQAGPLVQVVLSPLEDQTKLLLESGQNAPSPVAGYALIDTGASATCIDQKAAAKAGLAVVDSGPMHSATHANEIVPIYAGRFTIQGVPWSIDTKKAFGANLASQNLIILIGRDLLSKCILIYNGVDSSFSLSV